MKKLGRALLVLAAGLVSGLALVASAAGTTRAHAAKLTRFQGRIQALALDGNRIAYDLSGTGSVGNKVLVWNARTGKTTKVSGKQTRGADDSSTGSGVFGLAIAGTRVAWLVNVGGNTEGDDYLFESSVVKPNERKVASEQRLGASCTGGPWVIDRACAGKWLIGLVGSRKLIALNRWTSDGTGITDSKVDLLVGRSLQRVASGPPPFLNVDANAGRVVGLGGDGAVHVISSTGKTLRSVRPPSQKAAALSGHELVVLTASRALQLYDTRTGSLEKTFTLRGTKQPRNLDVQGNIAIYTTGSAVHAVNLSSGKDRVVGQHRGGPLFAALDSAGLVHASTGYGSTGGRIVFVPFARVAAAVS